MSAKWWAVYRGCQYLEHVRAVSGERALDAVAGRTGIPLGELDAVEFDLPEMELPLTPQLLREPVPTMQPVLWAQAEARVEAQREPGPAVTGKEVV